MNKPGLIGAIISISPIFNEIFIHRVAKGKRQKAIGSQSQSLEAAARDGD